MPLPTQPVLNGQHTELFCLRVTFAILYRAGLDALDESSPYCSEAQAFLESDFALLALDVLRSESTRNFDLGDTCYNLAAFQRLVKQRGEEKQKLKQAASR